MAIFKSIFYRFYTKCLDYLPSFRQQQELEASRHPNKVTVGYGVMYLPAQYFDPIIYISGFAILVFLSYDNQRQIVYLKENSFFITACLTLIETAHQRVLQVPLRVRGIAAINLVGHLLKAEDYYQHHLQFSLVKPVLDKVTLSKYLYCICRLRLGRHNLEKKKILVGPE